MPPACFRKLDGVRVMRLDGPRDDLRLGCRGTSSGHAVIVAGPPKAAVHAATACQTYANPVCCMVAERCGRSRRRATGPVTAWMKMRGYRAAFARYSRAPASVSAPEVLEGGGCAPDSAAALEPYPANLRDDRWYVLAWNRAESLIADWAGCHWSSAMWSGITSPISGYVRCWSIGAGDARTQLALFRMASRRHAGPAWLADFSDRLQQVSPEFRTWWSQHEVQQQRERAIVMQHPRVGRLVLERVAFVVEANPSLSLGVLLPLPDDDTAAKLSASGQSQDDIKGLVPPLSHPTLPEAFPPWGICEPYL